MDRKKLIALLIIVNLLLGQVSCSKKRNDAPAKPFGGILTIGDIASPGTLNPLLEVSGISAQLVNIIFDTLVRVGDEGEILPGLAVSWEMNECGREWIFHLREGVRFHDGHPFTADDVEFTVNLAKDPHGGSKFVHIYDQIEKIEARGPYTISMRIARPAVSFIHAMTQLRILPRHLLQEKDIRTVSFNYQPVGTGPFRLIRWSLDRVEFEANRDYFLGRPYLDRVVVKLFDNQRLVWAHLMNGEVDTMKLPDPIMYKIIKKIPDFRVYSSLKPYYYIIGFNLANPLFHDRKVRLALNYAIDREDIIRRILKWRGIATAGTISPCSWAFNAQMKPFVFNTHKAVELLKEAGWQDTDGDLILDKNNQRFEFQIYLPDGYDELEAASLMIVEQLSNIGIVTRVRKLPMKAINQEYLLTRKFDAVFIYISAGTDPDFNYQFWHSSQIDNGFNFFSYRNHRIDHLLDQGKCTSSQEKRKEIYYQYQEEMREDPPALFLFWRDHLLCVHKRFHGVDCGSVYRGLYSIRDWYIAADEEMGERAEKK
ncbi:MAG: ABC transporter substrate-binding protein [bacterium]